MQCDVAVEELFTAYYDCRRLKRNTANALAFEARLERNLMELYRDLRDGGYRPGRSICFVVTHPKPREIWAADFRDRVVHHLLYNRVADRFYRRFIHDSFACIPGKGALAAVDRLGHMMRSVSENYTWPAWFLKADIANFFVSIDKHVLDGLLARRIHEPWWMALCRIVLHHDPTQNVYIKSGPSLLARIPAHKSLFTSPGKGLPIGNLSSQFFANVYLDALDQFVKRDLKVRHYARYVDDMVLVSNDASALHETSMAIDGFLQQKLNVALHPNKTEINRIERGVNFVGYVVRPYARYIRRSTLQTAHKKLSEPELYKDEKCLQASVNSYLGMLRNANGFRQRQRIGRALRAHNYRLNGAQTKLLMPMPKRRRQGRARKRG